MPFQPSKPTSGLRDWGSALSQSGVDAGGREIEIEFDRAELGGKLVTAFRLNPHINNVLTHISGTQWAKIERALHTIMDPAITSADLSPLEQNIVELMWSEQGVTGRILKPYLCEFVFRNLPRGAADALLIHIADLCLSPPAAPPHSENLSAKNRPVKERSDRAELGREAVR